MDRVPTIAEHRSQSPETPGAIPVRIRHPHVVRLSISDLYDADSPRQNGVDAEHVQTLAEVGDLLPPISVHRTTMRVVDGMHRLAAALKRGCSEIDAVFVDCAEDDVFRLGVEANVAHGKPLCLADRRAAAVRIIRSHPHLSDRSIARNAGLAPATVAAIRAGVGGTQAAGARLGADGRVRPFLATDGRLIAARIIAERPDAPLREVASAAGISVSTASDVRRRLSVGQDAMPTGRASTVAAIGPASVIASSWPASSVAKAPVAAAGPTPLGLLRGPIPKSDPSALLAILRRDPTLRYTDNGREVLRWLNQGVTVADECSDRADDIPPHCAAQVLQIARQCARTWEALAEVLDAKGRGSAA